MAKQGQAVAPQEQEVWQDISHEEYRAYVVPTVGGQIMDIKIDNPAALQRLESGAHIIKDSKSIVHEINAGWVKLTYKVK